MSSTPRVSMSASTAARAPMFAWMSETIARRMGLPGSGHRRCHGSCRLPCRPPLRPRHCDRATAAAPQPRVGPVPTQPGTSVALERGVTRHHFTVDVEEYFHVSAFERHVRYADWGDFESRVTGSVDRLLDLLAHSQARAPFFVL